MKYNCGFQLTSFGANFIRRGGLVSPFKVQAQAYDRIGSPLPLTNEERQFHQLYFVVNFKKQLARRNSISSGNKLELTLIPQDMKHYRNSYIKRFKCASTHNFNGMQTSNRVEDGTRDGLMSCNEMAVLLHVDHPNKGDIVLERQDKTLQPINETSSGEYGYHLCIKYLHPGIQADMNNEASCKVFYAQRSMTGNNSFPLKIAFINMQLVWLVK